MDKKDLEGSAFATCRRPQNAMASGMDMLHSIGDKASEAFQSTSASGVADTIAGAAQNVGGFVAKGVDVASAVAKEVGDMMK